MIQNKLQSGWFYTFLVGLYTVFPRYFEVASVNVVNLIAVSIFGLTFFFKSKLVYRRARVLFSLLPLWISMLYVAFAYILHKEYVEAAMTLCNSLLICLSLGMMVNNETGFRRIMDAVLGFSLIVCIYGIVECLTQTNLLFAFRSDPYIEIRNGIFRISTTFDHPIVYANYLGFILTITFYRIRSENSRKRRNGLILLYILAALNLYLTGSRSAIIVIVSAQLFLFYCSEHKRTEGNRLFKVCIIPGLGSVALIALLLSERLQAGIYGTLFTELVKGEIKSITAAGDRFMLYSWVWEATRNQGIWGNGIRAVFSFQRSYDYVKNSIEVEYLYIFFKLGMVGLVVSLAGMFSMLRYSIKNKRGFNFYISVMLAGYYLILFAVTRQSELRAFYVIFSLCICYNKFTPAKGAHNQ